MNRRQSSWILVGAVGLAACTTGTGSSPTAGHKPSPTRPATAVPTPFPWILITEGGPAEVEDAVLGWAADMGIDARRGSVPAGGSLPAGLVAAVGPESDLRDSAAGWGEAGVWLVILDPVSILPGPTTSTIGPEKRTDQVGFLAGLAAGYATSVSGVGLAPGVEGEFAAGLDEGVRYACPRCRQEHVGDGAVVPFGIDVVVVAPGIDPLEALSAAGTWIVALGPEDVPDERLAARVITDPVPLVLAALEALMGGEPGRSWIFGAENGGLRIADVDPQAISPGRERLLREAEVRLRLSELAVGGGA